MRKIHIDNLKPGMKLAKSVFSTDGRVLITSGLEIKESFIQKLQGNGISEIYIEDDISVGIEIKDVVLEQTRVEARSVVKNMLDSYAFHDDFNAERIKKIISKLIEELLNSEDILVNLSDIKSVDDYTFEHSVNVCILSLITGIGMGYNLSRLKDLGVGAILHDIGKLKIPEEILKKPSQLTVEEFEEIKKHTIYGYEILKSCKNISMISAFIALGHHERYDGSGYPLQLKCENIHQCARIVAIADVYDALTSDRVYRRKLRPHEVIEYITSLSKRHFDKEIVEKFIPFIALYPEGTGVRLNSNELGLVVKVNRLMPTRPVIRLIYDKNGRKLAQIYQVDLSTKQNLFIVDTCNLDD